MAANAEVGTSRTSGGARVAVQKFGTFLSGMIMPNIAAFIAWGFITAFFIEKGWIPVEGLGGFGTNAAGDPNIGLVGPMITYMLPLLIAMQGGRMVYGVRGGVVAVVATMGVIVGTDIPMFLGAMIMAPFAAWCMKHIDKLWEGKIKPGFEMLVNNFSAGILAAALAVVGYFVFGPPIETVSNAFGDGVDWLVDNGLLPLASIIIEPAKVLFLNNALNHGVLTPLGIQQAAENGKSILFLLEANPGPGAGLLIAYCHLRHRRGQEHRPGGVDHPVLRRHPRDLLPVRAAEAHHHSGHHRRRHGGHPHPGDLRRRPAGAGGSRAPSSPCTPRHPATAWSG